MSIENTEVIENEELSDEIGNEVEISDATGEVLSEEYTPNLTYKVKDEERQFDDRLSGVINNKESEDYFRDLYTRADGLPSYKEKVSSMEGELGEYRSGYNNLYNGYNKLRELRDSGDVRNLLGNLGVSDDQVLDYAISLAKEDTLPEEQKQLIQKEREYAARVESLEKQVHNYESVAQTTAMDNEYRQLDNELSRPDLAGQMDVLRQKGLDPKSMVLYHGTQMTSQNNGVEPTIAEAVMATLNAYAKMPAQPEQVRVVQREATLPKASRASGSPADSGIRSIADIEKIRNQMF